MSKARSIRSLQARSVTVTILLGALGAFIAWRLGIPAPYLTGPAVIVSLAGLVGVDCQIPALLRNACFIVIGLSLGSSVTPQILEVINAWPASLIGMCISVSIVMLSGGLILHRAFGLDLKTSFLASSPGHLSYVIGLSTDIGADTAIISVIQSMRVLLLTLAVPVAVATLTDADMGMTPLRGVTLTFIAFGALTISAVLFGMLLSKIRVPAAFLISGMILSAIGHGTSLTPGVVPPLFSMAAFVCMGALIGTRFSGVSLRVLKKAAFAGVVITFSGLTISIGAATVVSYFTKLPLIDVIIGFAPGGLETMVAMGAIVGADPAYVAIHHVSRLFFLSAFVPLVLLRLRPTSR